MADVSQKEKFISNDRMLKKIERFLFYAVFPHTKKWNKILLIWGKNVSFYQKKNEAKPNTSATLDALCASKERNYLKNYAWQYQGGTKKFVKKIVNRSSPKRKPIPGIYGKHCDRRVFFNKVGEDTKGKRKVEGEKNSFWQ